MDSQERQIGVSMKLKALLEYRVLDLTALPQNVMTTLKKTVRKLANDEAHLWTNALELVHASYAVNKVTRPTPSMKAAWRQYEEIIASSVSELAKAKGIAGSWRTTDSKADIDSDT